MEFNHPSLTSYPLTQNATLPQIHRNIHKHNTIHYNTKNCQHKELSNTKIIEGISNVLRASVLSNYTTELWMDDFLAFE